MNRFICIAVLIYFPFLLVSGQEKIDDAEILIRLDREFDKITAERGIDGWVAYFAPNGSMIGDTSQPTTGQVEIRKAMEPLFKDSTFSLRWQPTKAEMLIPGVLGYTIGRYVRLKRNKESKLMKWTGSYSTIWKKQPDGSWKIIPDTGESDGPPIEIEH